jgi:hypothetical protein
MIITSASLFDFKDWKTLAASFPEKYHPAWGTIPPVSPPDRKSGGDQPFKKDWISLSQSFLSAGYHPLGKPRFLRAMGSPPVHTTGFKGSRVLGFKGSHSEDQTGHLSIFFDPMNP